MPVIDLFPPELRKILTPLQGEEGVRDPIVYIKFLARNLGWTWYVTEGSPEDDDFIFFGFVVGDEMEWGQFSLSELNEPCGAVEHPVERELDFRPASLSKVLVRE